MKKYNKIANHSVPRFLKRALHAMDHMPKARKGYTQEHEVKKPAAIEVNGILVPYTGP